MCYHPCELAGSTPLAGHLLGAQHEVLLAKHVENLYAVLPCAQYEKLSKKSTSSTQMLLQMPWAVGHFLVAQSILKTPLVRATVLSANCKPVLGVSRCSELLSELQSAQASSSQSQQQLQETLQDHKGQHLQWEIEKTQLQVKQTAACIAGMHAGMCLWYHSSAL